MQTLQGEYVLNHEVYLGKDNMDGVDLDANGLGHYVVTSMTKPFRGKYHHVYFVNFFNSPKLLQDLLAYLLILKCSFQ